MQKDKVCLERRKGLSENKGARGVKAPLPSIREAWEGRYQAPVAPDEGQIQSQENSQPSHHLNQLPIRGVPSGPEGFK